MVKISCFSQKVHNPYNNEHLFPLLISQVSVTRMEGAVVKYSRGNKQIDCALFGRNMKFLP